MSTKETPISIRAYAAQLNVNEKAVRKAIQEGKIKKGVQKSSGKILASKADQEWGYIHKVPKPGRGLSKAKVAEKLDAIPVIPPKENLVKPIKTENKREETGENQEGMNYSYTDLINSIHIYPELTYSEAIRRKEILGIAAERMKLEEQQGILVRKADVEKSLFAIGDTLKKSLLNIPARCIDDIMAAPNKIDASTILIMEIQSVLNRFYQHLQTNAS
jgi:hypothetical protein